MAPNTAEKNWPGSSVRATWVSQREVFLYPHATHLTNGSFVTKVDPSVVEPFRPEHGSSSFVKTIHLCTKYLRTWSSTLAVCRLLSSDNTEKCIVSLAVSRPTFFPFPVYLSLIYHACNKNSSQIPIHGLPKQKCILCLSSSDSLLHDLVLRQHFDRT